MAPEFTPSRKCQNINPEDTIEILIEGNPIAWKRAGNNQGRYYDTQLKQKEEIRKKIRIQSNGRFLVGPIKANLEFYFPIPISWSRSKKDQLLSQPHDQNPDLDNLIKFMLDTIQGVCFTNDCQIASIDAVKLWWHTDNPHTAITLQQMPNLLHDDF